MNTQEVMALAKEHNVVTVDLKFIDFLGTWQHIMFPASELGDDMLENGRMFDGSSIRCWQTINASDMKVVPDLDTAKIDPFFAQPTLSLICDIQDPVTGEGYSRDPRSIARKAQAYLASTGIADTAYFGPEAEFFIFDNVQYSHGPEGGFYSIDSTECPWNTGTDENPNLGYKTGHKLGYFPVAPFDTQQDMRVEMVQLLEQMGIKVERHHHEVAPAQHEINYQFNTLVNSADDLQWFKYIVRNVARQNGKTATFMPKPMFNDNGSGMHTHQSLWKDGKPLFAGDAYAGLSETALYYIGGILKHAPALGAFINPTTNSYKRLVPGFEAPINLAYSARNRSATIRIPVSDSPKARRIEFRCPDAMANAYIAFSAMMMAGLDGIQNKIHPGDPMDVNIYDLPPEELDKIGRMPRNLREALESLEADHDFLLKGDVFTKDVVEYWVDYKLNEEIKQVDSRPHPHEFTLYYGY
ncbi:MAG: type I glutamate--ammonia ligase [bacterium]|jgi:glutamine synthetase